MSTHRAMLLTRQAVPARRVADKTPAPRRARAPTATASGTGGKKLRDWGLRRFGALRGSFRGNRLGGLGGRTTRTAMRANEDDIDAVTKKWGLEAGLWKVFRAKPAEGEEGVNKMDSAKKLLKRYGSAYLVTSISLSLVSITVCYALISAGVDVASLLEKVGLSVTSNSEKLGTFALAYAAHKAASPIRFPPTVALTPVVAGWMGKDVMDDGDSEAEAAVDGPKEN